MLWTTIIFNILVYKLFAIRLLLQMNPLKPSLNDTLKSTIVVHGLCVRHPVSGYCRYQNHVL